MQIGIDCATTLTAVTAKKFKDMQCAFVGRYVKPGSWKTMEKAEADIIRAAGLSILSVYERSADRTKGGAANGTEDGADAYAQVKAVGQPVGSGLYFAVDYDAPASDFDSIEAYLRAAAWQVPGYAIGVYGSYAVIEEMKRRGAAKYFWQTVAWSQGKVSVYANVYQRQIDVTVNGVGIDWNDLYSEAGLWGEDDDMDKVLDIPDWEWKELDEWASRAWNDKYLADWQWNQKIRDKKLTYRELLLLKVLLDERRRIGKPVRP